MNNYRVSFFRPLAGARSPTLPLLPMLVCLIHDQGQQGQPIADQSRRLARPLVRSGCGGCGRTRRAGRSEALAAAGQWRAWPFRSVPGAAPRRRGVCDRFSPNSPWRIDRHPVTIGRAERALAEEGVTRRSVAWEDLPDGRRMMVLADEIPTHYAILREDGSLFINPDFLAGWRASRARPL